ncbi:hypothetical protein ACLOJK_038634 [Asimina triloba]
MHVHQSPVHRRSTEIRCSIIFPKSMAAATVRDGRRRDSLPGGELRRSAGSLSTAADGRSRRPDDEGETHLLRWRAATARSGGTAAWATTRRGEAAVQIRQMTRSRCGGNPTSSRSDGFFYEGGSGVMQIDDDPWPGDSRRPGGDEQQ